MHVEKKIPDPLLAYPLPLGGGGSRKHPQFQKRQAGSAPPPLLGLSTWATKKGSGGAVIGPHVTVLIPPSYAYDIASHLRTIGTTAYVTPRLLAVGRSKTGKLAHNARNARPTDFPTARMHFRDRS